MARLKNTPHHAHSATSMKRIAKGAVKVSPKTEVKLETKKRRFKPAVRNLMAHHKMVRNSEHLTLLNHTAQCRVTANVLRDEGSDVRLSRDFVRAAHAIVEADMERIVRNANSLTLMHRVVRESRINKEASVKSRSIKLQSPQLMAAFRMWGDSNSMEVFNRFVKNPWHDDKFLLSCFEKRDTFERVKHLKPEHWLDSSITHMETQREPFCTPAPRESDQ